MKYPIYLKTAAYHIKQVSEHYGVIIDNDSVDYANMYALKHIALIPCEESEVNEAFERTMEKLRLNFYGVSLNDNLPTEALEHLTMTKSEQSI